MVMHKITPYLVNIVKIEKYEIIYNYENYADLR